MRARLARHTTSMRFLARLVVVSLAVLCGATTRASADTIITGTVTLACGTYPGVLLLTDDAIVRGSGRCTIVGGVRGVSNYTGRQYRFTIEQLLVDGMLADGYIGIDLRNVSRSVVRDVSILHVQTGVLIQNLSLYNLFENVTISLNTLAWTDGYEILGGPDSGANQTTIIGGAVSGAGVGIGVYQRRGDYLTIIGTAFEGVAACFDQQQSSDTALIGVRCSP